ncbi:MULTISPECIES: hypothetical protein [unclassified Lentimicrobium]|uniref:hypothetical protein n=1 Tax=unclassified Lentimicrobium TaxID=2677434 RepID=UPI001553A3F8|nr:MULTISPECIES: hypothetical protein [unclassified Lentimicrobium]NPD44160.1 hypothetical protein [Lentimicrobium sp. S6]NPD84618.1 hypothetical protein [Lentimicrobium sp. L6]
MKYTIIALLMLATVFSISCKKEETTTPSTTTTTPEILSLTSDKSTIKFGGEEPAIITCEASGGNCEYTWEVDLGDIFVLNEDGSQVRFTGSECCIGDKIIKCTVKNDKGEVTETVTVNIYIP